MTSPLIFDGHNDTLRNRRVPGSERLRSFFERSDRGHLDLPRATEGGFGGGLFAVFVPSAPMIDPEEDQGPPPGGYSCPLAPPLPRDQALPEVLRSVSDLLRWEEESAGALKVVRTASEVKECLESGVIAAVLHLEGAEAIDPELHALRVLHRAGLRSLGPVWSRANEFATGVPFRFPHSPDTGPGLTEAGHRLVRGCNELGILVDLSHMNERGFWDVAEISSAPLVATHSCVHALCPSTRNLTDRQLDAIGETGGVVGINFSLSFLREDGLLEDGPLDLIVRHVAYVAERIGVEHVALGSDFDGAKIPGELGDAAGLPRLMAGLEVAGFRGEELVRVAQGNWVRVLERTWGG